MNAKAHKNDNVADVFRAAAPRYDIMNDLMSGGLHRIWKGALLSALFAPRRDQNDARPFRVLDLAAGSGDVGLEILRKGSASCRVSFADSNPAMLALAEKRLRPPWRARADLILCDAEALPLQNQSFEACALAFGIRNMGDRNAALSEIFRVLRPGGRFLCLELARPSHPWLQPLYDAYAEKIIPRLGGLLIGREDPYRYLVQSVRAFPKPQTIADDMREAGFSRVSFAALSGGVATLYAAWRF